MSAGESFDVLVIDYKMPEMTGLELARRIRALRGDAAPQMVMFTSVTPAEHDFWSRGREAGFIAVLTKPAKSAQLLNALGVAFGVGSRVQAGHDTAAAEAAQSEGISILLVDDNKINRKVGKKILKKIGYEADTASSGQEAINRCAATNYDVVLMDIEMPEMDGVEASKHIREREAGGPRPFIIALTANAMVSDRESYLAAGMDDYVSKPIAEEALAESLRAAVRFRHGDQRQPVYREQSSGRRGTRHECRHHRSSGPPPVA
jgi:CheY-like chemotaxis protein